MSEKATRSEHDLLGNLEVDTDAYWGVHTERARHNFPISEVPIGHYRSLIWALAQVKTAAAEANRRSGALDSAKADLIIRAAAEVAEGKFDDQFVVDVIQGGAGTSTNMNANEVIANRALELAGHTKGEYNFIHPLNDVNESQSTNDVYPTAVKLATVKEIQNLVDAMEQLCRSLDAKAHEFRDVVKMGRTQLQEAVPMTLGQEFAAFSRTTSEDIARLREGIPLLCEINMGGTAIGTQLNAPEGYAEVVRDELIRLTGGLPITLAADMVEATQDAGVFVTASGLIKRAAVKLSKMANDLRLLSSGPRAGLAEINLPPRQAGSSIMPGKVNPVIPEVINQIAFTVIGADLTVTMAAEAGQLQLNAFEPIICRALLMSANQLSNGVRVLAELCIDGITANVDRLRDSVTNSIGLVTALAPRLGYETATEVAQEAAKTGATVRAVVIQKGLMTEADFDAVLGDVEYLTSPLKHH
jgi:aspartate ammonia-lyase